MKTRWLLLLVFLSILTSPTYGQFIEIRLSIKVIVHPTSGARPTGLTDALLNTSAAKANIWMGNFGRGYRYRIIEIVDIGGPSQGGASGPSKWFGQDPRGTSDWPVFQNDTQTDTRYLLRSNQVNYYITTGPVGPGNSGGACPRTPGETNWTACHAFVDDGPWWLVHESGHFFGLPHTFGGNTCSSGATTPGDDGIPDTLPEISCWNQNQIANHTFGRDYDSLTSAEKKKVDDTYFNVMSYHESLLKNTIENRMTELQLDRHADTANSARANFVSGKTRFVDVSGSDTIGNGSSTLPYRTATKAIEVANNAGGDIILLRPGVYIVPLTISKPCTLRATRNGSVTIVRQ